MTYEILAGAIVPTADQVARFGDFALGVVVDDGDTDLFYRPGSPWQYGEVTKPEAPLSGIATVRTEEEVIRQGEDDLSGNHPIIEPKKEQK